MKIVTFGSCLSRFTATNYARMFGGQVVGSVYHNRIDRFVETYVQKSKPEMPLVALGDYEKIIAPKASVIVNNQLAAKALGKHGTIHGRGFMKEVEQKVDLIIMDNFIDILARLVHFDGVPSSGLFISPKEMPHITDRLTLESKHLDIDLAIKYWDAMIAWLRARQKGTRIYFINFPFGQHPSPLAKARTAEFESKFKSTRVRILPIMEAHPTLVSTPSHFDSKQYAMLAGYIWKDTFAKETLAQAREEGVDDIFNVPTTGK